MTPYVLYSHEMCDDGKINVLVPKFTDKLFSKLLMPRIKKPFIRANLDEFGSQTWLLMNGSNKVYKIAEILTEKYGDTIQPANERVITFLTHLYQAGFISFNELKKEK